MVQIQYSDITTELTPEEIEELETAEKMPIIYDEDSPKMTSKMLKQFHPANTITIKLSPQSADKVRELGPNYQEILDKLISLALDDKALVEKCI